MHKGRMEVDYMSQEEMIGQEHMGGLQASYEAAEGHMYDGIGLTEEFLDQYYSQKASCEAESNHLKDGLLLYEYEGNGSLAGSVGCCSILEADNDLEFLNDLGPKFKTLASICKAQELIPEPVEVIAQPQPAPIEFSSSASVFSEHSAASAVNVAASAVSVAASEVNIAAPPLATSIATERNVVVENSYVSAFPQVNVQESVVIPSQTYLVQQPMYYAAAPVMQPARYVIEPQMQSMYVMSDVPVAESVVVQERRVIGGPAVHGGVIGVQQGTLNRGENVVLVERQMGSGQNILFMEREGAVGQGMPNGILTHGTRQREIIREQGSLRSPASLVGMDGSPIQFTGLPGSQKIVVQEKRVISS
ncbi:hypothetical protein SKAU_G00074150 [Synaphobranchus kaupii]|uniref:Cadherin Y-type LIR-motif domain-containing protein n=1 Tax=Synaphobranchus kaupii TaxID=118154 RepID=A0A9Q1G8Y5_SYNKA|nr:hypothetical protein SKAU_G00074150 [Synaphobranchus kaupii]